MIIAWYGQSCFKIESRGLTIAVDPYDKSIGLNPPHFKADILLSTHAHFDHANLTALQGEPVVISGPGEYEVKGVGIRGVQTFHDNSEGKERGLNTVYVIALEDMKLCHLGDFGEEKAREDTLEDIGDVDILMIPVGGTYTIDGKAAAQLTKQIEPRMVIPMHYALPGLKVSLSSVGSFLKEMGVKGPESPDKLVIKKKDLPQEETRVLVLKKF